MSRHESYITKDGAFHFIHRQKGGRCEVLRYRRLDYTDQNVSFLCGAITDHLTPDLISHQVRRAYPAGHPAWKRDLFGYCVPASFALLYFLDTDALVPFRGIDMGGEGHWWLADRNNGRRYDITGCQYTEAERNGVYASGRPRGYYGRGEAPAARFLRLMNRVQPESELFVTDGPGLSGYVRQPRGRI